ncbi:metallophosphoesterase [Desulfothermus okinawensis JCM 13304]
MRIAVISDTHMRKPNNMLIDEFESRLRNMDAIFHLGDYTNEDVYYYLNSHPRFYGVRGNMDSGYWTQDVPTTLEVKINNIKFGFLHGNDLDFLNIERDITNRFSEDVNFLFFGHTHIRFFKEVSKGKYILNPGSFTYPKMEPKGYSILEFDSVEEVKLSWINL